MGKPSAPSEDMILVIEFLRRLAYALRRTGQGFGQHPSETKYLCLEAITGASTGLRGLKYS